jgi:chorismate--pyruvate lyase
LNRLLQYRFIEPRAAYDDGGEAPRELWARRSEFRRGGRPILVTEIFLPEILKLHP